MKSKSMLRISAILLAALTLLLASCGESGSPDETKPAASAAAETVPGSDTPVETEPVFADADFGGRDFVIYMRSEKMASYPGMYIDAEETNGDVMNDSVVSRNTLVEKKFNLNITTIQVDSPHNTVKNEISGGTVGYDLILDRRETMASLATGGCLANLVDCGVDYTTAWWAGECVETYTVQNKLFFVANDVSVSNLAGGEFYYFNTRIVDDFKLTSPYDYVKENKWTWETFITMVNGVSNEAAEGVIGTYGLCSSPSGINAFLSSGIRYVTKVGDEYKCLIYTEYADRAQRVIDLLKDSFKDPAHVIERTAAVKISDSTKTYSNDYDHIRGLFAEGHFLFISGNMKVSNQFLDMQDTYGVVVYPKLDSDQERYYTPLDTYAIIWCVPNATNVDAAKSMQVLDYWAYQSSKSVMPAYYEVTLKSKRAANTDGANMLDLIKETICYDITDILGLTDVEKGINAVFTSGSISTFKSFDSKIKLSIKKLMEQLDAIE